MSSDPDFGRADFYLGDPDSVFRRLRRESPVHSWKPGAGPAMWIVTRWSDVRSVSRQPELFCSSRGIRLVDVLRSAGSPESTGLPALETIVHMDPPRHGEVRSLLNKVFTPRRVAALEPWMRGLCRERLERLPADHAIDLVSEIAAPIPAIAIARILGVPEAEWRDFQASADALIQLDGGTLEGDAVGRAHERVGRFFHRLQGWIRERKETPTDDLLSALVHVEEDSRRLDPGEVLTMAITLLVAGNETTRTLISGACLALHEHPDQRRLLVERPDLVVGAIEEFLRWVTPVHSHARTATRETELGGRRIRAGEPLVMMYRSANRDEAVWPDADRLDVTRPADANPHLAFGHGEHFCLGASLARLEARVVVEELLARFPRFAIAGAPVRQRSTHFNGIESVPVVLQPDA